MRDHCLAKFKSIAEYRIANSIAANNAIDEVRLGNAIGNYIKNRAANTSAEVARRDQTIDGFLKHLDRFNLAGTVTLASDRRLLFFTPKLSGWYVLALLTGPVAAEPRARLELLDASVLTFASEEK